jgi:hypothetical protein
MESTRRGSAAVVFKNLRDYQTETAAMMVGEVDTV